MNLDMLAVYGITQTIFNEAEQKVNEILSSHSNMAKFKDENSEKLFKQVARFWLCLSKISDKYDVKCDDRVLSSKKFVIDFDRDENHEEQAFPDLSYVMGHSTITHFLDITPLMDENHNYEMCITVGNVKSLLKSIEIVLARPEKINNLAEMFGIDVGEDIE